jgi:hypothetical protein
VQKKVNLVLVEHMDEVLNRALLPEPIPDQLAGTQQGPEEEEPQDLDKEYVEEPSTTLIS